MRGWERRSSITCELFTNKCARRFSVRVFYAFVIVNSGVYAIEYCYRRIVKTREYVQSCQLVIFMAVRREIRVKV